MKRILLAALFIPLAHAQPVFIGTGADGIYLADFDPESGKLTFLQHAPCGGRTPRHFKIDPSGKWLLCGHQNSDTISILSLDPETGLLGKPGSTVKAPKPICILFP